MPRNKNPMTPRPNVAPESQTTPPNSATASAPINSPLLRRWEYVDCKPWGDGDYAWDALLDDMASQGYRLHSIYTIGVANSLRRAVFEREVTSDGQV